MFNIFTYQIIYQNSADFTGSDLLSASFESIRISNQRSIELGDMLGSFDPIEPCGERDRAVSLCAGCRYGDSLVV